METKYEKPTEVRRLKGIEIAKCGGIERRGATWIVPSQRGKVFYIVSLEGENSRCNCPFFDKFNEKCKHIFAVEYLVAKMSNPDLIIEATNTKRVSYSQNWVAYNAAQTSEKLMFMKLLHELLEFVGDNPHNHGRPRLSLKSMLFASALKVYSQVSLRRFISDLQIAKDYGYIEVVPCFTSVGKIIQNPKVVPILQALIDKAAAPLKSVEEKFAADSTGFKTSKFTEYFRDKYEGVSKAHSWIKVHAMVGVKTHIVTAVVVGEEWSGDSPNFVPLVRRTHNNGFDIKEVSADKAYSGKVNLECVDKLGGTPYIPFKSNDTPKPNYILNREENTTWSKYYHYFMLNREQFMEHYHKRSNVETAFFMIKSKFNDQIKSKSREAQMNEALLKVLCNNIVVLIHEMNELGIKIDFTT